MDVFLAIRLFLLLCIASACSAEDYRANTMLSGFEVYSWETLNQYQCVTLCMKAEYCLSVNFNPVSRVCELNNQKIDRDNPGHPMKNYMYIAPVKSDGSSPCGKQCLENELCTSLDSRTTACLPIDRDEFTTAPTTVSGGGSGYESIAITGASSENGEESIATTTASSENGEESIATTTASSENGEESIATTTASSENGEESIATTTASSENGEESIATTTASNLISKEPTTVTQNAVSTEITTIAQDVELGANFISLYTGKLNWGEANAFCRSKSKTLLSMKTLRKAQALSPFNKFVQESIWLLTGPYVWSALRRNESGEYNWADCSPLGSLTFWNKSVDLKASRDDCVKIHVESLEWFPAACDSQIGVVCEEEKDSCWFKRYRDAFIRPQSQGKSLSEASHEECRHFCLKEISQGEECIAFSHNGSSCFFTMGDTLIHVEEPTDVTCRYGDTIDVKQCFAYIFGHGVEKDIPGIFPLCANNVEPQGHFEQAQEFQHSTCQQQEDPEIPPVIV